jgi:hypothetical protein
VGGLAGAWLAGVAIVAWRESHQSGHMPVPAALMGVTGLFALLALAADIAPAARPVITLAGWGLDVAGFMNILPAGLFGQISQAQTAEANASDGTGAAGRPVPVTNT